MASSSIRIKKVCEWCGEVFYAQKTTTRYCSHRCNSRAYKE
ncbi:MAG: DNA-binding protein, partial [Bacteroides sp.]